MSHCNYKSIFIAYLMKTTDILYSKSQLTTLFKLFIISNIRDVFPVFIAP